MFVGITNTPRDYAWGSPTAIADLFGRTPPGGPQAELWLGAHPGSPSLVVDQDLGYSDLAELIAAHPQAALGRGGDLPFLLKVLAAASPLSLQAHPTAQQAATGFARENAAGIPVDAPHRNYRDDRSKPELVYALSETFEALCGFRPAADIRRTIARLIELDASSAEPRREPLQRWLDRTEADDSLGAVFEWLIARGEGVDELVARVVELARANPSDFATVVSLADTYPGDPGIVISLLLHRVTLRRGEALFLPAGNIHAYLSGLGVELMTASDNVLRGGLTPKHVDVEELLSVLDFRPVGVPYLAGERLGEHVEAFRPPVRDFQLVVIDGPGSFSPPGPAIAVCARGSFDLRGAHSSRRLERGDSVFISPDEGELEFSGGGHLFLATTQ
jgi:mannose-6-phosphate isomerase